MPSPGPFPNSEGCLAPKKGTVHVTKESEPVWTQTIFAPKRGGSEATSHPGPESSLETPRTVRSIHLSCTDPPWSPTTLYAPRTYGTVSVHCALPKGSCVRTRRVQKLLTAWVTGAHSIADHEERLRVEKCPGDTGQGPLQKARRGWGCDSEGRALPGIPKAWVPQSQHLGGGGPGVTETLQRLYSHLSTFTLHNRPWDEAASSYEHCRSQRSQEKPRNTLFCERLSGRNPGPHTLPEPHPWPLG